MHFERVFHFLTVVFMALPQPSNQFSTSEVFGLVLDVFGDTRFHDTQVASALCITQYRYLVRNADLIAPEPDYYASCPYSEWLDSIFEIANANFVNAKFRYYVSLPDVESALRSNPSIHFDAESFIPGSNYHLMASRIALFQSLKSASIVNGDISSVQKALGQALHTLQDFYSHTNWVELGNTDINSRVGEDSSLGIDVNGMNNEACQACSANQMNAEEEQQLQDVKNSILNDALLKLLDFSYDNVQVCHDNIVTDKLTTGYYGFEAIVAPKPTGKCSHGGGTDQSDTLSPSGGINKDAETLLFSPHYYLHQMAANLSTKATIRYLDDLRIALNDEEVFGRIIGLKKDHSYAFIIDVTLSMKNAFNAVQAYVADVTNEASSDSIFYVIWFSDPYVGPVRIFNASQYVNEYVMSLVPGDVDSDSKQCYEALLKMANAVPSGTIIDVFTNGSSDSNFLQQAIQNIAQSKQLTINFILGSTVLPQPTYRNSSTMRRKRQTGLDANIIGYDAYRELAFATNGIIVDQSNLTNVRNLTTVLGKYKMWETVIYSDNVMDVNCANVTQTWHIPMDDTMSVIEIVLTTKSPFDINVLDVEFLETNDIRLAVESSNQIWNTSNMRVYRFETQRIPKVYVLRIHQSKCPSIPFTLHVRAQTFLRTTVQLHVITTAEYVIAAPLLGDYSVSIDCPDCAAISKISISLCGAPVDYHTFVVQQVANKKIWRTENVLLDVVKLFCVSYIGRTNAGFSFERVHREKIMPTTFTVSAKVYSSDFPFAAKLYRNSTGYIDIYVKNDFHAGFFSFSIYSRKLGALESSLPKRIFLSLGDEFNGTVAFRPNIADQGSNFDTIDITVIKMDDGLDVVSKQIDVMTVRSVASVKRPFCNITAINYADACHRHRGSSSYDVEITYGKETNTPLRLQSTSGAWEFGATKGIGIVPCHANVSVTVFDDESFFARCHYSINTVPAFGLNLKHLFALLVSRVFT